MAHLGNRKGRQWFGAAVVVLLSLYAVQVQATDYSWNGPPSPNYGIWSDPASWSPGGVPATRDKTNLIKNDTASYIIYYYNPPSGVTLNTFSLFNSGSGGMYFYQGIWGDSWQLSANTEISAAAA